MTHLKNNRFFPFFLVTLLFLLSTRLAGNVDAASLRPARFVSQSGITLLVLEQPSIPIISVQILIKAGSILDPAEKSGLANMTASLLEEGTTSRSATEISDAVDFIGAKLRTRASKDYMTAGLRILKKDVETGFSLLSDLLIHPQFDPKEIERVRKNILGGILAENDQPQAIARRAFQSLVFREHPYRRTVSGEEKTVQKIKREDIVQFHQGYYRPNNAIIAIVGDVTAAEAKGLVERYFGSWQRADVSFSQIPPSKPLPKKERQQIEKNLSQSTIILGHVGIDRSNPDYYAVRVMNYILGGGGFSSRMMTDIRDNKGLVYSIYSYFSTNRSPGTFSVSFQTKTSSVNEAIEGVLREIEAIQKVKVREEELSEAKAYLSGSFPLRIDTTRKVASLLTSIEFHDLGLNYFDTYTESINGVTREEVQEVAKKYLHPEQYALVIVGKQDKPENK